MTNEITKELFNKLENIAKSKVHRDLKGTWSQGSTTYLNGMYDELNEVKEEIISDRQCFLEDELGDVLWDYLCMLQHMQLEGKISTEKVFERAVKKYSERVTKRKINDTWDDIKQRQKKELLDEYNR